MKKKKSGHSTTILLVIVFLAGLSLLLYPSIANYWNSFHSSRAIASYSQEVADLNTEEYDRLLIAAAEYNADIVAHGPQYTKTARQQEVYDSQLRIRDNGVMGQIEIPSIDVSLPIFHGTSDVVLQQAVGHLDWTSLPVGGTNTHCVLSGHRGLPSAKLFTHLDKLAEGDVFLIRVLDEVLTYEVDQILIVEPEDTSALGVVKDEDYCTLVTCTPYGINTHRLLVRGHRIETEESAASIRVVADAIQVEEMLVAAALAVPLLTAFLLALLIGPKKRKHGA